VNKRLAATSFLIQSGRPSTVCEPWCGGRRRSDQVVGSRAAQRCAHDSNGWYGGRSRMLRFDGLVTGPPTRGAAGAEPSFAAEPRFQARTGSGGPAFGTSGIAYFNP
jgi:hypothetical protein